MACAQFPRDICTSFKEKPQFFLDFTGYTSFIHGDWGIFSGMRAGLNYNQTVKVGLGFSYLNSSVVTPIHISENELNYTTNGLLRFTYAEATFEYIFYKTDDWQLSFPLTVGGGKAHYKYISRTNSEQARSPGYAAWIVEPAITAQYILLDCAGANASLGYRSTLAAGPEIKSNLNSVTFSLGFQLLLYEIYRMAFPKKE
jgi:hypothetical protein